MTVVRHLRSKPALQAILYIPVILGLIILAGIALRWSLADVYATQVSHHLGAVKKNASHNNAKQWRLARQHMEQTLALRSTYARYFELAEDFCQRLDSLEFRRDPLIQELDWHNNELEALNYARLGLRLAPSWPNLWNRLVMNKFFLKQFDHELTGGMERSVHLGAWERSTQYKLAVLGLHSWPILQDKARNQVLIAIEQTLAMEKIKHSAVYDINKILSHPNFAQACDGVCKQFE